MSRVFKKLGRGASNFFKKIDSGASNFFKKTIPDTAKKVGGYLDDAGDWVVDTSKKVGNTLEKYSDDIAMGAGLAGSGLLYATGYGAPAAAALMSASMAAGNAGKQFGAKIKDGSNSIQSLKDKATGAINQAYSDVRKGVNQMASDAKQTAQTEYQKNLQALSSNVGMAKQMARDNIQNVANATTAKLNTAISGGANALTNAVNNVPSTFV